MSSLLTVVAMPIPSLSIVGQLHSSFTKLGVECQLWISLIQFIRVVVINVRCQIIIVDLYMHIWVRMHGMHCHRGFPVVLAIMILALILWHHAQPGILVIPVMVVVIPGCRWQLCLGILHPLRMLIILLIFFTPPYGDEQLGDTHTVVVSLVHYHRLKFWSQSIKKGFLGLMFQIARSEHIVVKPLKLYSDSCHTLVAIFGQLVVGLLDTVKLVQ